MKDLSIWLVVFVMILSVSRYVYQIKKNEIKPALSTWIIFFLGTALSFTTYVIAEEYDFHSGILNTVDLIAVIIISIIIIIHRKKKVKFQSFEKWYLLGVVLIICYGFISKDAWRGNTLAQILIGIGYIPTVHKLVKKKRNTESLTAWGLSLLNSLIALYPAIVNGNTLAILYATRTIVSVSILVGIMIYYEIYQRKQSRI